MKKERIIFFGSGDFPRNTFVELFANKNVEVVGLVTSHDKCEDGGTSLKDIANGMDVPCYIANNCSEDLLYTFCKDLNPTMFIVISFKKIPMHLLELVHNRAFNIHASMLPLLSGANPIRWAIRNKMTETGLTAIRLYNQIDTGSILHNLRIKMFENETYGELKNRMMQACPLVVNKVISEYDTIKPIEQSNGGLNLPIFKAPKLTKDYFRIGLLEDVEQILKSVLPYNGIKCKIVVDERVSTTERLIGFKYETCTKIDCTIWGLHKKTSDEQIDERLAIYGFNSNYIIDEIQIEGKKRMKFKDFLNGFKYLKKLKEDENLKFKKYQCRIELN